MWKQILLSMTLSQTAPFLSLTAPVTAPVRKALDTHHSYREHFGGRVFSPSGIFADKVPDGQVWVACNLAFNWLSLSARKSISLTLSMHVQCQSWLGMDPRSQKAADFAAKFLYDSAFDYAVKQAVRHQQALEEVLEHSGIEKTWAEISAAGAKISAQDTMEDTDVSVKSNLLLQCLPQEHVEKLSQPEHAAKLEVVENAVELARKQVRSQIQTVDGSLSLDRLAKSFRSMECSKLRGTNDSSVIFVYMVEAAGEHERDARRSPTPMRREQMEKVIHAWMCTRSVDLPDLESERVIYPQLHASDVILGLHLTLISRHQTSVLCLWSWSHRFQVSLKFCVFLSVFDCWAEVPLLRLRPSRNPAGFRQHVQSLRWSSIPQEPFSHDLQWRISSRPSKGTTVMPSWCHDLSKTVSDILCQWCWEYTLSGTIGNWSQSWPRSLLPEKPNISRRMCQSLKSRSLFLIWGVHTSPAWNDGGDGRWCSEIDWDCGFASELTSFRQHGRDIFARMHEEHFEGNPSVAHGREAQTSWQRAVQRWLQEHMWCQRSWSQFLPCHCPIVNDVNDTKLSMTLLMVTLTSHNSFCFRPWPARAWANWLGRLGPPTVCRSGGAPFQTETGRACNGIVCVSAASPLGSTGAVCGSLSLGSVDESVWRFTTMTIESSVAFCYPG